MEDRPDDNEFVFTLKPDPDPEIGQYVIAFEGPATAWDDDIGDDRPVGHIRGHRIDLVSALHDGLGQDALLESLTPEIADVAQAVLSDGHCLLRPPPRQGSRPRTAIASCTSPSFGSSPVSGGAGSAPPCCAASAPPSTAWRGVARANRSRLTREAFRYRRAWVPVIALRRPHPGLWPTGNRDCAKIGRGGH